MSDEKRNLPASIHQRLLNKSYETGRSFNELLQYYGIERLLYRLSISEHAQLFTLKGALMFNVWGVPGMRPTRDIDLLSSRSKIIRIRHCEPRTLWRSNPRIYERDCFVGESTLLAMTMFFL